MNAPHDDGARRGLQGMGRRLAVLFLYSAGPAVLAVLTQNGPFTTGSATFAVLCALPFLLLSERGHLAFHGAAAYPSIPWVVLTCWVVYTVPSMIVVDQAASAVFDFDEAGIAWGRVFFLTWLWLCALVVGRPAGHPVRWELNNTVYTTLSILSFLLFAALFANGYLFAYLGLDNAIAGSIESIVSLIAEPFLKAMLGVYGLAFITQKPGRAAAAAGFLATLGFIVASGVRNYLVIGIAALVWALRVTRRRPSFAFVAGTACVVVWLSVGVVAYRNALSFDPDLLRRSPLGALTSMDTGAITQTLENLATRLWYGPQFFAAVSNYLSSGPALSDTWKEGFINLLPTAIAPDKAHMAQSYDIEFELYETGRYPQVDLSPTPWMHAVFDYGAIGLVVFAIAYGLVLRWVDRALIARPITWVRWFVFCCVVATLAIPEAKLDSLVIDLREPLIIAAVIVAAEKLLRSARPPLVPRTLAPTP